MKKSIFSLLLLFVVFSFSSCRKELDPQEDPATKTIDDIVVSRDFNWKTTKDIDVELILPTNEGLMRSKITSVDGTSLFYKGYPADTTTRLLETIITIPSYIASLSVSNGITKSVVDLTGDKLVYDFNNAPLKNAQNVSDDDCGECDGQITELTLLYIGSAGSPDVVVTQDKDKKTIFEGTSVMDAFTFRGVANKDKMGVTIKVYVNDELNVEIHTSCSVTILAGMTFGDFKIISGESSNGGSLCAVDDDSEDDSYAGTVIYEDLFPAKGDYDFNDLVINYNFDINKTDAGFVETIDAIFTVKAFGASFHNAFGFQFPTVTPDAITSVSGSVMGTNTMFNLASNGTELNQTKATFLVYDDSYSIMQHPGSGIGVNTTPGADYVSPVTIALNIVFEENTVTYEDLNIGNFNPFIVINQDRDFEVHLANYEPTDLFDISIFETLNDDSDPSINRYFLTQNNLPWALNIPEDFRYLNEKSKISAGYLKFIEWAESEGEAFSDWYLDISGYRDADKLYQIP